MLLTHGPNNEEALFVATTAVVVQCVVAGNVYCPVASGHCAGSGGPDLAAEVTWDLGTPADLCLYLLPAKVEVSPCPEAARQGEAEPVGSKVTAGEDDELLADGWALVGRGELSATAEGAAGERHCRGGPRRRRRTR